jgi:hypothetical protein
LTTYILGGLFYADPFHFWQHAFSEFGINRTLQGSPNILSAVLFSLGMLITGRFILDIAFFYQSHPLISNHKAKMWLSFMASMGAFLVIFPNNLFHTLHSIGSAMIIGPFFILELIYLWEQKERIGARLVYWITFLLSASVLTYAVTFFANSPIKQVTQKICMIHMFLVLWQMPHYKLIAKETSLTQHL